MAALRYASVSRTSRRAALTTPPRTNRKLQTTGIAVVFASAAAIQWASAQVNVDVSSCVELTEPEDRLACFEAQVEAARDTPAAPAAPTADGASRGQGFERKSETTPPDILAKVTELRETVPNSSLITLDNGQVWRQTVPEFYPLRPGSEVRIYYSRWRAYRLTSPVLRGYIQVERVR
jgi:hypothetical protein